MGKEENTEGMKQEDINQAKDFARSISAEDIKSGKWFVTLIDFALKKYREKVNATYFQEKYPGLPPDAIADRRIDLAQKYAALEGASTALAYTTVVAATIGPKGGRGPSSLIIPTALTAFAIDIVYTSTLQLRLAYDISIIYGKPLNYDDPEDLYDLLVLAFGIKAGEVFSESIQKLAPEATRIFIKKTVTGPRLEWLKALPVVGTYLAQRNLIKMAIPVIGIGLGSGINYISTGSIGKRAKKMFRLRGAIEEVADQVSFDSLEYSYIFLQTIWLVIKADKQVQQEEAWYLRNLVAGLEELGIDEKARQDFETKINFDEERIINQLRDLPPEFCAEVYKAACVASVVDGIIKDSELLILQKLAEICNCDFDRQYLDKLVNDLHGT